MKTKIDKTLYKKNSRGKIQQWEIFVEGNEYWAEYGQVDGKIQSDTPTVCDSKNVGRSNETTPEEQALFEAEAKYKKQIEIKGYVEDLNEVDKFTFKTMLAHPYNKHSKKLPEVLWSSKKLDGVRCYITKDGAFSRNGKRWVSTKFIEESLQELFEQMPDLVLDGELYSHKYHDDFNKIISLAKKTKHLTDNDWKEIRESLEYHVFDIYLGDDPEKIFRDRYGILEGIISYYEFDNIKLVKNDIVTKENFHKTYEVYMSQGYEGIMLRDPDSPYECKRSYSLQKYKEFRDEEFEIVDILEGDGNRSGMFGRFVLVTEGGERFEANSRGNEDYYRELWSNKEKYIGKMVTVRFQNKTPDKNVPRFPVAIGVRDYE
jgi:ATP-dependent DNA ligase